MSFPSHEARLNALARLLEYPGTEAAKLCRQAATPAADRFQAEMQTLNQNQREELYTATFDVAPACVPYLSIHLFGEENFQRGEFMAGLQARYAQTGFNARGELPDHLAVVLRFAAQTDDRERRELVEFCLLGPVEKMIEALNEANPYRSLLEAVRGTLLDTCPDVRPAISPLEQMRQHGMGCDALNAGCGCGASRIQDGPQDEPGRPFQAASGPMQHL